MFGLDFKNWFLRTCTDTEVEGGYLVWLVKKCELRRPGLAKTRVLNKKTSPVGFLGFIGFFFGFIFWFFWVLWVFSIFVQIN
jgi:hypothetical protein